MVGKRHYSKLGPRQELLRIQKALFNKNKRIISETISIQDKDFLDYEESYHQELKHYEREAKIEELYDVFEEFPIILMGDFHTNKQSQRSFLRVIRGYRKRHSNFVIALEAVHAKKQKVLDKFIAGEIELADLARKLDFKKNFHFNVWSHFKAIFEFAFFHKIKILALEAAPFDSGLKKRDQEMVKVIAQSLEEYPRHKVFVLVGDLHIAEKNLPSLIYKNISYQNAAPKVLKIFQNYEGIYWSLAEKALENSIELVKVSENAFCLLNTPPLVWQQGYLHHLDHEDEIDYTDLKQQFLDILVRIAKFLGLQIPSTYEEIEVFTWNDLSLIDSIEKDSKFTNLEKSIIKEKINKGESYFISKKNWVYLGDMSLNHVAEQACFYLKYLLIGEDFPRSDEDAFYANVLRWTKAYFASKVINHKRKTSRERDYKACISGKDFKTGQTLMKTILAPGLKSRYLGVKGWFSTNILGNRDGEVLDDPESFKTKEVSKLGVLDTIFQPELYPDLYGDLYHKVRINYYPPRGDNKEGWDNIDIVGWCGYPMQIKVDFLCKDSILAAPLVLDLVLFSDLAQRAGMSGIQEWLSFYYKSPMTAPGLYPEHNLFIQEMKLKNNLRYLMGEDQITHLGREYYE